MITFCGRLSGSNDGMGYKSFVCVESGAVSKPVTVAAGAEWVGEMKISSRAG